MKKIISMVLAAMMFVSASFAASVTISSEKLKAPKDVVKIVNYFGWDVLEDASDLFVAASEDKKDFAVIFCQRGDLGNADYYLVSYDGYLYSRVVHAHEADGKVYTYTLLEHEDLAVRKPGKKNEYDIDLLYNTISIMNFRNLIKQQLTDKYGIIFPEYTRKNAASFNRVYKNNVPRIDKLLEEEKYDDEVFNLFDEVIKANFENEK